MARTPDSNVAPLSAAAVMELARITGVPVDDAAMAARIAAGAANAVAAVREGLATERSIHDEHRRRLHVALRSFTDIFLKLVDYRPDFFST